MQEPNNACWVCEGSQCFLYKPSNLNTAVTSRDFVITDTNYGVTGELIKCSNCGFIQCTNLTDVLNFYEDLEDPSYEATRKGRALQAEKMMLDILKHAKGKRLLDIGAGSGILVEEARKRGVDAVGIEPSRWLWQKARDLDLPVTLGIFPHAEVKGPFDVITLIDVIEHVNNPVGLLKDAANALSPEGILVISTPDIGSIVAKILGNKWWHLRVAHIGYFTAKNLKLAAEKVGLRPVHEGSAKWYFAGDYVIERVNGYLPKFARLPKLKFLKKITIPFNLGDSAFIIFKK